MIQILADAHLVVCEQASGLPSGRLDLVRGLAVA